MQGLMQDWPLTVDKILDHAKAWHGDREVVSRSVEGPIVRTTYAQIHGRAKKVSNALLSLGVTLGDRVATMAWCTGNHMDVWYGIMGIGAICHTLNPRLHPQQIAWIVNHAGDRVIFTDLTFQPLIEGILPYCPSVEHVVFLTDAGHMPVFTPKGEAGPTFKGATDLETLIAGQSADCAWGGFDENTAGGLCYTSGTTGDPKGVLYSHRSNFIHTLSTLQADVMGVSAADTVLAVVPMFHANGWGLAFSGPASGAKLVMPGAKLDGASLYELIEAEQVTFTAAVPTVWQGLLAYLAETGQKFSSLKGVLIGGAAVSESTIRAFRDQYGVEVTHAWGMTETSPLGTVSRATAAVAALDAEERMRFALKQGRPPLGVELKVVDAAGNEAPHDGRTFGHLKVKGPFVARAYYRGEGSILDPEGFFDTGDVATLDEHGYMQITDRSKDVIKSGGEWISSIEIENIALGYPKTALAAVIARPHPKWDERPLLVIKLKDGETATAQEYLDFLQGKIAKWWMPDDVVFVDDIPLGATGKIDKKLLRTRFEDYVFPLLAADRPAAEAAAAEPMLQAPDEMEVVPVLAPEDPPLVAPLSPAARRGRVHVYGARERLFDALIVLTLLPAAVVVAAAFAGKLGLIDVKGMPQIDWLITAGFVAAGLAALGALLALFSRARRRGARVVIALIIAAAALGGALHLRGQTISATPPSAAA
jgi:fatty-acyl-CoA synthase